MKDNKEIREARIRLTAVMIATASVVVTPIAVNIFERHDQSLADRAASLKEDIKSSCVLPSPYIEMCWDIKQKEMQELEKVREELGRLSTPTPICK